MSVTQLANSNVHDMNARAQACVCMHKDACAMNGLLVVLPTDRLLHKRLVDAHSIQLDKILLHTYQHSVD